MPRRVELAATDPPRERESFRGVAFAPAEGGVAVVRRRAAPLGAASVGRGAARRRPVDHGRAGQRHPAQHEVAA
jgi:hypothetical protein